MEVNSTAGSDKRQCCWGGSRVNDVAISTNRDAASVAARSDFQRSRSRLDCTSLSPAIAQTGHLRIGRGPIRDDTLIVNRISTLTNYRSSATSIITQHVVHRYRLRPVGFDIFA